jgi:hypothetical protein
MSYEREGESGSAFGAFLTKISKNMNFAISVRNSRTAKLKFLKFAVGEDLNFVEVM